MRWKVLMAAVGAAVLFSGIAVSQEDPIAARKALMKANDAAARTGFGMMMGKVPFDAAAAAEAMNKIADDMAIFPTLFPEGSDTGDTKASPEIWANMDDFKARAEKLATDAKAAAEAAAGGLDAFKPAMGAVGQDCQGCHQVYRLK